VIGCLFVVYFEKIQGYIASLTFLPSHMTWTVK